MEGCGENEGQEDPPSHLIAPQDRGDLPWSWSFNDINASAFLLSSMYVCML